MDTLPLTSRTHSAGRIAVAIVASFQLLVLAATPSDAATPSPFATLQQPISVGALPRSVLATRFCADKVLTINKAGTVTTFVDLPPTGNSCLARDLVVSRGFGGFPRNHVFAVQKQTIYQIPSTGGMVRPFVNIGSLHNSETSLTFDTVGTFGFNLLATDRLGPVWSITSGGVATQIADVGHHIEGGQVAPLGFAQFGGQLLATDDFTNSVFAIDPDGTETFVAAYDQPESVEFVPRNVCEFADSGGAFFVASQFGNVIYKFPSGDFADIDDGLHALVMTKVGKIGVLSTDGTVNDFETGLDDELEDSTFFPCPT